MIQHWLGLHPAPDFFLTIPTNLLAWLPQPIPFKYETERTMNTYVATIGGKAVLTFRAMDEEQANVIVESPEGSLRSDLQVLIGTDGKPLWDGTSAIDVREATAAEHAEWERSRDQAISDGEINLDAHDNLDDWNVYPTVAPKNDQ
jgi:hypothetical protein